MRRYLFLACFVIFACSFTAACQQASNDNTAKTPISTASPQAAPARDAHSFSNPEQARVRHVALDLEVLFDRKVLKGASTLTLDRAASGGQSLKLDTRDLKIFKAEASSDGKSFAQAQFALGEVDKILGAPLTIQLPAQTSQVRIEYESSPTASGVQWLGPAQTAGKKHPYVFTQSEAIHARSWIPLQDSPAVRVPRDLNAMSPTASAIR